MVAGRKRKGAHGGHIEVSGMLGLSILLAYERNYLGNLESNSMCFNSCFKETNCLERVRKTREKGVNTPCVVPTFQTHQSRQQPETVGLKVKTPRA